MLDATTVGLTPFLRHTQHPALSNERTPAERHLTFAECCSDNRSQLCLTRELRSVQRVITGMKDVRSPSEREKQNGVTLTVTHAFPRSQRLSAAIGKIALAHAWLDNALRMLVKDLAGVTKEEALDSTARQGSWELRRRVRTLGKARLGEGPALVDARFSGFLYEALNAKSLKHPKIS